MIFYILAGLGIVCFGTYACLMFNLLKGLIKTVDSLNESIRSISSINTVNNVAPLQSHSFKGKKEVQEEFEQRLMKDLSQLEQPKEQLEVKLNLESKKADLDTDSQAALDFLKKKKD